MHIETTIDSVKVTFEFRNRETEATNLAKNVAKNVAKNLTGRQQQILDIIRQNPQVTRVEIATAIGVSAKTIERELATMSKTVRHAGSKKKGYWDILPMENE